MTCISEELRNKVAAVLDDVDIYSTGDYGQPEIYLHRVEDAIAYAILTERNRCDEIATAHLSDVSSLLTYPPKSRAAWAISNAINSGEQP